MKLFRDALLVVGLCVSVAQAQTTYQWTNLVGGVADGSWSLGGNWSPTGPAAGSGSTAQFTQPVTGSATLTLDGSYTVGNLLFGNPSASPIGWTINSGAPSTSALTLSVSSGAPTITVTNQSATLGAVVKGNQGFTFNGGVLNLNAADTYTGLTTVNAGALVLNHLNAIAAGNSLNIANGAVVQPKLAGTYAAVATTLNGSGNANGSYGGSLDFHSGGVSTIIWPGQLNLNAASSTIGSYGVTYNVTLSGQLTGPGGLKIRPEGGSAASHTATFTLSNPANDYAGNTTMQVGTAELSATLKAGVNNALPVTTALNLDRAGNSGVVYFDLAGYSQTVAGLTADFGSNAVINSTGTGTLTVSNTADTAFNGAIGASGKAGINLIKQGAATLALNGTNSYTGVTTIGAGTLALNGLITATGGLQLSNNATLRLGLGAPGGPTNIVVNGNVTLAGQIDLADNGLVANTTYPVIYYSGSLSTNGLTISALPAAAFTIDTSVPHVISLVVGQKYPLAEFTSPSFAVSTLTTNLSGILRGPAAGPIWYEVRDQTNKLWDFGATLAVTPWNITVRHLREGTNTVTIFAQDGTGAIQSNRIQLTLTLGEFPAVRPRPIPSEIWWGGLADNYQMTNYSEWPFVQKYEDGYFMHSSGWGGGTAGLQQSLATNLFALNTKYWTELGGGQSTITTNTGHAQANTWGNSAAAREANGIIYSEFTHDYHMEDMKDVCQANPTWSANDQIAFWTGDLTVASGTYPYDTGIWRDAFNDYYARFPHVKVGHTSQPEWWPWGTYPAGVANQLAFTVTNSSGQNINFSFNASNIFASFMTMAVAIGHPYFSMQSDAPWDYFGGGRVGTSASEATMRQMIRAYEQNFQSRDCRHTLICNVSNAGAANQGSTNAANLYYENSSLSSMYLHQQEGGRANRYLFEGWYFGIPYAVVPETQPGSYTHLALSAIKYLKGIRDTNGTLEPLAFTLSSSGVTNIIQLTNNGDVTCLPAVVAFESGAGAGTITYYNAAGSNITAAILSAEGYVHTNQLNAGQGTQIKVVATGGLNRTVTLEAFWNPQDPTGVVRDRLILSPPNQPPTLSALSNLTAIAGQTIQFTNTATDPDGAAQALTFSLLTAPVGASLNSSNGVFQWRPTIAQSPLITLVKLKVADNGSPTLSATQSFYVTVQTPAAPAMSQTSSSHGLFSMQVNGDPGPDYLLLAATNLTPPVNWLPILTNASAAPPFWFSDAAATNFNQRFYRIQLRP